MSIFGDFFKKEAPLLGLQGSGGGLGFLAGRGGGRGGLTATGGIISDYEDSGTYYRAHIFTSSGAFNVTASGTFGDTIETFAIGGGGGGKDLHTTAVPKAGSGGSGIVIIAYPS